MIKRLVEYGNRHILPFFGLNLMKFVAFFSVVFFKKSATNGKKVLQNL